jgi:hypothetical protein
MIPERHEKRQAKYYTTELRLHREAPGPLSRIADYTGHWFCGNVIRPILISTLVTRDGDWPCFRRCPSELQLEAPAQTAASPNIDENTARAQHARHARPARLQIPMGAW